MKLNARRLSLAVLALSLLSGRVEAAPLGLLPTDSNALPGWNNISTGIRQAPLSGALLTDGNGHTLSGAVEYAVYAPGAFDTSSTLGFPAAADPSDGTEFVYAYEIFNSASSTPSTMTVQNLSVSLVQGGGITSLAHIGNAPATPEGGWAPDAQAFIPGTSPEHNAKWTYTSTLILPGNHSDILLFTSPYGPVWSHASTQGGFSVIGIAAVPSPIPEPATAVLSLVALGCLIVGRLLHDRFARR